MKYRKFLLKGIKLFGCKPINMLIIGNKIAAYSQSLRNIIGLDTKVIDADGLICLPGFVDLHSHLRDPGFHELETIESAGQSAALGGYTAIHSMPNSLPVADNIQVVEYIHNLGILKGWTQVKPIGAVTVGLKGTHIAEMMSMHQSLAKVVIFSDDGFCIQNSMIMRRALEYVKTFDGIIAQHSEDMSLTQDAQVNEGVISAELGLIGWPSIAEESIILRDILLSQYLNSRLHICHVSTEGSVKIIRWAKKKGINVTSEVTPHHLILTEDIIKGYNPVYKVNPPLRTSKDVLALQQGLLDGTIDAIATDHAPHSKDSKECEWHNAKPGVIGLETAFSIIQKTMFNTGLMSWEEISQKMSFNPARIGKLENQGCSLKENQHANLTLIDPNVNWIVDSSKFACKSSNTPFEGMQLPGKIIATFYEGNPTVLDGRLNLYN